MSRAPVHRCRSIWSRWRKVQATEDAWNTRDPLRVVGASSVDSMWRNRGEVLQGHGEIIEFLRRTWEREPIGSARSSGRTATTGSPCASVRSGDADGRHFRSYGNELSQFDALGY